jgi:hypothetical protein
MSARVVAPARMLMTSWPGSSRPRISRPTRASIWGLIASSTTWAPSTALAFESTVRMPWDAVSDSRRSGRGWLATI